MMSTSTAVLAAMVKRLFDSLSRFKTVAVLFVVVPDQNNEENGSVKNCPRREAVKSLPSDTLLAPEAVELFPIQTEPSPVALWVFPIAIQLLIVACDAVPITTVLKPLAVSLSPMQIDLSTEAT